MSRIRTVFVIAILGIGCDRSSPLGPGAIGPVVSSLQPNSGPADLTNAVRINGSGFQEGATVTFAGAASATDVTFVSETVLTATTPIHTVGAVDVVVTNPAGQSGRLASGFRFELLEVVTVSPPAGYGGELAQIRGAGFHRDATVTVDGVEATVTGSTTGSVISAIIPMRAPGHVNLVVFNPNGTRATYQHGFTYEAAPSLSVNATEVPAGAPLIITWVAPVGRASLDWIGIFRAGEENTSYLAYTYTGGSKTGTWTFPAPSAPGRYDFRYLLNDGYQDVMRTAVVTVTGHGLEPGPVAEIALQLSQGL